MNIDEPQVMIQPVSKSELLGLASWNRSRTPQEIMNFISRREAEIFSTTD